MRSIRVSLLLSAVALTAVLAVEVRQERGRASDWPFALRGVTPVPVRALLWGGRPDAAVPAGSSGSPDSSLTWFERDRLSSAGVTAIRVIAAAGEHGLDPSWYDAARLDSLARSIAGARPDSGSRRHMDSALTVAMMRLLHDLRYGRVKSNPLAVADSSGIDTMILAAALANAVRGDSIDRLVLAMQPAFPEYAALRTTVARYRALPADSGFSLDTSRLPLHIGDTTVDRARLVRRLSLLGDAAVSIPNDSPVYDSTVAAAVARFQARHGLTVDSVLGPETAAALAVPVAERVRQLELALERVRWLPRDAGPRLILVNVATFRLRAFDSLPSSGRPTFSTRVIVGTARRTPTPMLRADVRSVDFRPYWNVPRSILVKEILPALRRKPDYLRANDMEAVLGEQVVGDSVTPALIGQLASGVLRVRQRPGPGNALGRVRFDLPNDLDVYLHDTPQRALFARARRDFSHGCVRVEHPDALARWSLGSLPGWATRDSVERAMAGPASRRVPLPVPVPIVIEYRTATIGSEGHAWFFPDIYGLDAALSRDLAAATRVVERLTEPTGGTG